jgi:hypothetical protein
MAEGGPGGRRTQDNGQASTSSMHFLGAAAFIGGSLAALAAGIRDAGQRTRRNQMDNDVVIITACDQRYFPLCLDLIASIRAAYGFTPRIRVLDVGMTPGQIATLAGIVEKVITPIWDVGEGLNLPTWYRAMTARPFLPKYVGEAAIVVSIDSDAWVQRRAPLQTLIDAARSGELAIVEERFGKGFSINVQNSQGHFQTVTYSAESVKANVRSCYQKCFGDEIADALANQPSFNAGIFALRTDSPSWAVWREIYAPALVRHFHSLVEQQALNVAIRQGRIPIAKQPPECNYTCHLELPWYSAKHGVFTLPNDESQPLGIVHLCDAKKYPSLPIPQFPHGHPRLMPLFYGGRQVSKAVILRCLALEEKARAAGIAMEARRPRDQSPAL